MPIYTNINGTYRQTYVPASNINGAWRNMAAGHVNINGVWRPLAVGASQCIEGADGINYTIYDAGNYLYAEITYINMSTVAWHNVGWEFNIVPGSAITVEWEASKDPWGGCDFYIQFNDGTNNAYSTSTYARQTMSYTAPASATTLKVLAHTHLAGNPRVISVWIKVYRITSAGMIVYSSY